MLIIRNNLGLLRFNIIIRSPVSGTLVGRDGERYPINRWFHQPMFNPSNFYDDGFPLAFTGGDNTSAQGAQPYSVLETSQGKFRANVKLWRYEGSSAESFRVELTVDVGESIP